MPRLVEEPVVEAALPVAPASSEETIIHFELSTPSSSLQPEVQIEAETAIASVRPAAVLETDASYLAAAAAPVSAGPAAGGYLTRPANIYAEAPTPVAAQAPTAVVAAVVSPAPVPPAPVPAAVEQAPIAQAAPLAEATPVVSAVSAPAPTPADEPEELQMQLIEKEELPAAPTPLLYQIHTATPSVQEEGISLEDTLEQQRRAADRLQKLRNLSYNVNTADPNNEFETVPAYVRRNMELYNSTSQIENFYSSYEVKDDPAKQGPISTLNTFLDGKKPD
jgi:cell division protein FtsZ